MRASTRERLIRSIEYHEDMACQLGGEDHMDKFRQRREEKRKASEAQQESDATEDQDQSDSQRRRTLDDEQQNPAPEKDERSPDEIMADIHADAACQIRELLAAQPTEPAINRARRQRDASGTVPRAGQPRPRFAS